MKRMLFVLVAAGCTSRPLEVPDLAVSPTVITIVVQPDLAQPPPCTLTALGDPVVTISVPELGANFYSGGLFRRREGRRVVHYGHVHPDANASDWAFYAREYDVSSWPPTALTAATQIAGNEHFGPTYLFEASPDTLSAIWWTEGGRSGGTAYSKVDGTSFAVGPQTWLQETTFWDFLAPTPLLDGKSFAILTEPDGGPDYLTLTLRIVSGDGTEMASHKLDGFPNVMAFGQTKSNTFLLTTPTVCGDGGCSASSIDLWRLDDTYTPIKARSVQPIGANVGSPTIVSDGDTHHFLIWWGGPALYAQPINDDGSAAAPTEVWFEAGADAYSWGFASNGASAGPMGVVLPIVVFTHTDAGAYLDKSFLVQRQLADVAPISVMPIDLSAIYYGFSTVAIRLAADALHRRPANTDERHLPIAGHAVALCLRGRRSMSAPLTGLMGRRPRKRRPARV